MGGACNRPVTSRPSNRCVSATRCARLATSRRQLRAMWIRSSPLPLSPAIAVRLNRLLLDR
jgi:hypothetical protein